VGGSVLAYVYWHRPAASTGRDASSERALERFHRSLAHVRPSGFHRSTVAWVPQLPWEEPQPAPGPPEPGTAEGAPEPHPAPDGAYEDWHLVDGWSAIGVLEEAAVSRGHLGAHEAIAAHAGSLTASIYRLIEGQAQLAGGSCVWVGPAEAPAPRGSASRGSARRASPTLASLLGDGMEPTSDGLWRRCLSLGPAPEYCLQRRLPGPPTAGVAPDRLPSGWRARTVPREVLFDG
jgi:hypothetical protein